MTVHSTESFLIDLLLPVVAIGLSVLIYYTKPRPYASDIDHWLALRLQDHQYE